MRKIKEDKQFIEIKEDVKINEEVILEPGDRIRVLTEMEDSVYLGIVINVDSNWIDTDWEDASMERYTGIISSIEEKFNIRFTDIPGDLDDDTIVAITMDRVDTEKVQDIINYFQPEFKKIDYYLFPVEDENDLWDKGREYKRYF